MKIIKCFVAVLFIAAPFIIQSQIIHVPEDQPSIQEGINAASDGDTVLVADSNYMENIKFMGKEITVASYFIMDGDTSHISNTIIDGSSATDPDSAAVVSFIHGEDTTSILAGFTITGGHGNFDTIYNVQAGGGIYACNSGCKIIYNHITDNHVENDTAGAAGIGCIMDGGDYWVVVDHNTINYNTSAATDYSAFGGGMAIVMNSIITNNTIEYNTCINYDKYADGGGIEIELVPGTEISSVIRNNMIRFNHIEADSNANGGGIMSYGVPVEIENNTIVSNSISATNFNWGGGIAAFSVDGPVKITSNTIQNNSINANYCYGGGIELFNCQHTIISDNDISYNSGFGNNVMAGAGIWMHTANDTLLIINNQLYENISDIAPSGNSIGGNVGIYITNNNPVIIKGNKIKGSYARYGGGLYTYNTFNSRITNNLFIDNEAIYGGAVYFRQYNGRDTDVPVMDGDPLYGPGSPGRERADTIPVMINNTFYNNHASNRGGAIYSDHEVASPVVINSIFWENTAPNGGGDIQIMGFLASDAFVAYCDIDTMAITGNWQGMENIYGDPEFIDTLCHISGPVSPCADAGADSVLFNGMTYYSPTDDFEGDQRPYNEGLIDIGADETDIWVGIASHSDNSSLLPEVTVRPNPVSGETTIEIDLKTQTEASLVILNSLGQLVSCPIDQSLISGKHRITWNTGGLAPGLYFYRLTTINQTVKGKIIVVR